MSHTITYAIFQIMVGLFMSSPLSKMTAEGDFITLNAKQFVKMLEQTQTAGIRYYFTLKANGKISAVIMALDSNAQEQRTIILNAESVKQAEREIKRYEDFNMVNITGTIFGTIGIGSQDGKLVYSQGKEELLQLARSGQILRAYYALKESPDKSTKHLILCFAAADNTGAVSVQRSSSGDVKILDFSGDCPPSCRYP